MPDSWLSSSPLRGHALRSAFAGLVAVLLVPTVALAQGDVAPQTHTVTRGDTLWDLARRYLGDPFLWPEIFKRNTAVVEDPHWIYPGEVLQIAGGPSAPAVPGADTPAPVVSMNPNPSGNPAAQPAPSGQPGDTAMAVADEPDATPGDVDDNAPIFPRIGGTPTSGSIRMDPLSFRALRPSEFYAAAFLTEGRTLSTGHVLGPVTPLQIASTGLAETAAPYTTVVIEPPLGGRFEVGDSLVAFRYGKDISTWGDVVQPTGLIRVTSVDGAKTLGLVVAVYAPLRAGQFVMRAEPFSDGGRRRPVPIADGVSASVIGWPDYMELKDPLDVLFLDKGKADGVRPGDVFEVRRTPLAGEEGAMQTNDLMATVSVTRVGDHTATVRVVKVVSPKIAAGTRATQVARLPS